MRKSIALLVCIFCASACWGQYPTTYQDGVSDVTAYLATMNAWTQLPTSNTKISVTVASDGSIYYIDSSGCASFYDLHARTYTQQTSWGCGWSEVTNEFDSSHGGLMVGVLKTDASCPSGTKRFYWSYSGAVPTNTGVCASHWYGASDTSQLQLARTPAPSGFTDGHSFFWDGAAYHDVGTGWTAGGVASGTSACAVKAGQVYMLQSDKTFGLMSPQPATNIVGCVITSESDSMFVWGQFNPGIKRFDFATGVWSSVLGVTSPKGMATGRKGTTIALGAIGGVPYHLNVYAGFISGTTSGSVNTCPTNPCPPSGVVHTGTLKVALPHGIYGAQNQQAVSPTTNMNVSSFDVSLTCDPIYGDPADPECQGLGTGSVICSASGANFTPNGPSQPPHIGAHFSEWVGSYTGNYVIESQTQNGYPQDHILYIATITCGAVDTCRPPTYAVCSPPRIAGTFTEKGADWGPGASKAGALAAAENGCRKHSITGGNGGVGSGAWGAYSNYDVVPGLPPACSPAVVFDATPYVSACY